MVWWWDMALVWIFTFALSFRRKIILMKQPPAFLPANGVDIEKDNAIAVEASLKNA